MEDLHVYQRLNQINRQKAALGLGYGGCDDRYLRPDEMYMMANEGMGEYGDYDGYLGNGVLVGGRRRMGGYGVAGQKNPAAQLVGQYMSHYRAAHPNWDKSRVMKAAWAAAKQDRDYKAMYGAKAKARAAQSKAKRKIPAGKKMGPKGRLRKLTPREQARVGKRYARRNVNKACIKEDQLGPFYLNPRYVCQKKRLPKKKRS